jgi:5-methylcytosine-specific restriction enzyme subunit McrC
MDRRVANAMKVPILNIYYMLVYAWDVLDEAESLRIEAQDCTQLVDLFAKVLHSGAETILRRGLDRGYLCRREALAGIRGKLDLSASIKANVVRHARTICEYDELSHDVLHNRVLKSTIRRLLNVPDLSSELRDSLAETYHRLQQISEVAITDRVFRSVQLYRSNRSYRLLLDVCRLVHQAKLTTEEAGEIEFRDFFRDEHRMRQLFEKFVRNFYRREQTTFRVGRTNMKWQEVTASKQNLAYLPKLQTDATLSSAERVIVIETKFVPQVFVEYRGKWSIRSSHLYQLFAYLKNIAARIGKSRPLTGILLYPSAWQSIPPLEYCLHGNQVKVCTLDLNQHWREIEADLLRIIDSAARS